MKDNKKFYSVLNKAPSLKKQLIKLYQEYGKGSTVEKMAKKHDLDHSDMLRLIFMGDRYLTEEEEKQKK